MSHKGCFLLKKNGGLSTYKQWFSPFSEEIAHAQITLDNGKHYLLLGENQLDYFLHSSLQIVTKKGLENHAPLRLAEISKHR